MVHRLIWLLVLLGLPPAGVGAPTFTEMEKDRIREEAQMDIMRHPADTNIEPDVALIRTLFRRTPSERVELPATALSSIQVFVEPEGTPALELLSLIAATIGYELDADRNPALNLDVRLSGPSRSIDHILADIEKQAGLSVWLYPDSKRIVSRGRIDER